MRRLSPRVALGAAVLALAAGNAPASEIDHAAEYARCIESAETAPEQAFESALAWEDMGGGAAARHCAAVALIGLGHHEEAAERLEALAAEIEHARPALAIGALAQAGQAWLLAGEAERAYAVQSAALDIDPDNVELLVDRGVTLAQAKNYREAVTDLSKALLLAPNRPDILIYRASAYRFLDDLPAAREDVERALVLDPDNPEGLLERGNLRRLAGDLKGARQDWVRAALLAEGEPTGEAAQANLATLDMTGE